MELKRQLKLIIQTLIGGLMLTIFYIFVSFILGIMIIIVSIFMFIATIDETVKAWLIRFKMKRAVKRMKK